MTPWNVNCRLNRVDQTGLNLSCQVNVWCVAAVRKHTCRGDAESISSFLLEMSKRTPEHSEELFQFLQVLPGFSTWPQACRPVRPVFVHLAGLRRSAFRRSALVSTMVPLAQHPVTRRASRWASCLWGIVGTRVHKPRSSNPSLSLYIISPWWIHG